MIGRPSVGGRRSPNAEYALSLDGQISAAEPHRTAICGRGTGLIDDWRSPSVTLVSNGVLPKETHQRDAATSRRRLTNKRRHRRGTGRQSRFTTDLCVGHA
jgi:hypothetical protein